MHCYRQQGTIEVTSSGDNQGTLVATELGFWSRKDSQMECRGWGRDFLCPISGITVLAAYCLVSQNSIFSFFFFSCLRLEDKSSPWYPNFGQKTPPKPVFIGETSSYWWSPLLGCGGLPVTWLLGIQGWTWSPVMELSPETMFKFNLCYWIDDFGASFRLTGCRFLFCHMAVTVPASPQGRGCFRVKEDVCKIPP